MKVKWFISFSQAALALNILAGAAGAATLLADVQANNPQVNGEPASNTNAVFPTNKQNETTIAVNPVNGNFLIAGANDEQRQPPCGPGPVRGSSASASDCSFFPDVGTSGIYTSNNGGVTWVNRGLLDDQAAWIAGSLVSDGDPVIVYGPKPNGRGGFSYASGARAYYATLVSYKRNNGPYPANKAPEYLAVSYSDDNGATWSAPILATSKNNPNDFNDKEALWVDDLPTSPFFGRLYISWTEFRSFTSTGNGSEPIMVSISTDGGATFAAPKQVSPAGNNGTGNGRQGSAVTSGPDGSVYVAWEQGLSQVVSISRDGGNKWSKEVAIGSVTDIQDPIPGANFRTSSFPSLAADPRPGSNNIYAAWSNRFLEGGRIVISQSTDNGKTWGTPTSVSTASQGYAFYQGLDVAPNGRVDLGFQALTSVNANIFGTGNANIDSWYTGNSGSGWSMPIKVSSASSDPAVSAQNNLARQFWGDYHALVSDNTHAWFIYTDSRTGSGCAAVDNYQVVIAGSTAVHGDMADRIDSKMGLDPYSHAPDSKPAPPEHCATQYGNTDPFVSVIAP